MKTATRKMSSSKEASQGEWHLVGHVAVDSGQLLLTDPAYLGKYVDDDYNGKIDYRSGTELKPSYTYSGCCIASQSRAHCGQTPSGEFEEAGFVTSTGYGDGDYPVYVRHNKESRVTAVLVVFVDK